MGSVCKDWHVPGEFTYDGLLYSAELGHSPVVMEQLKTWTPRDGDVLIASYPKAGSTWSSTVVQYLLADGAEQKSIGLHTNPFLENRDKSTGVTALDILDKQPSQRLYKSHLHTKYLQNILNNEKAKTFVIMRNPKDVIVSYYHLYRNNMYRFEGDFSDFMELVKRNDVVYGNMFEWCKGWWPVRQQPNVMWIMYEDMLKDPFSTIKDMGIFLGKDLSDDVINNIVKATSFKSMSKTATFDQSYSDSKRLAETFFRKGEVGDWVNWLDQGQSEWVDEKCKDLLAMGLEFQYNN